MSKSDDFADGMYREPADTSVPADATGCLRVMAVLTPCRTSTELEQRARDFEAHTLAVEAAGYDEIEFLGEDGIPETPALTDVEYDAFKDSFTPEEWAALQEELR
jgi:hypothetical protein